MLTTAETTSQSSAATHTTLGSVRFSVPQILRWCEGWHLYVSRHVLLLTLVRCGAYSILTVLENPTEGYVEIIGQHTFYKENASAQTIRASALFTCGLSRSRTWCFKVLTHCYHWLPAHFWCSDLCLWGQALSHTTSFLSAQMQQKRSESWMLIWK